MVFLKGKASDRRANDGADPGADHLREIDHTPNKTSVPQAQAATDPRLIFLERAAARLILFEAGLLDLDEAFQGLVASLAKRKRRRRA